MNSSGDAAEQIVRMSLEGVEVAARITGTAAKEIALLLLAAMKSPDRSANGKIKLRGKERLNSMLKSGKALEIFSVKNSDLKKFMQGAKEYGIVYCVLRNAKNNPDGLCDVMVKADDAPKISRLIERFNFATVDKAKIESEIVADKAARASKNPSVRMPTEIPSDAEPEAPDQNDTDKLLDDLLGTDDRKTEPPPPEAVKAGSEKPEPDKAGKGRDESPPFGGSGPQPHPSAPISDSRKKPERATSSKPSVKEEIREIKAARKKGESARNNEHPTIDKPKDTPAVTTHKQPQRGKLKPKSKGSR